MWRVVAIMLYLNPHRLSVPIGYVVRLEPSFPPSQRVWRFELITDALEVYLQLSKQRETIEVCTSHSMCSGAELSC